MPEFKPSHGPYTLEKSRALKTTIPVFDATGMLIADVCNNLGEPGSHNSRLLRESWAMHQLLLKLKKELAESSPDWRHVDWIENIDEQLKKLEA